jgi:mRNA interferase MazF
VAQFTVKRGSVVLIRYPFTDLTSTKVRPAVVLTPDRLIPRLDDTLCLFISSSIPAELLPTDFVLEPGHPAFSTTGLRFRSVFRCHKLALLHKSLVLRVLGEMDNELMEEINLRLQLALGLREISTY